VRRCGNNAPPTRQTGHPGSGMDGGAGTRPEMPAVTRVEDDVTHGSGLRMVDVDKGSVPVR
jgi:hypothetical protein